MLVWLNYGARVEERYSPGYFDMLLEASGNGEITDYMEYKGIGTCSVQNIHAFRLIIKVEVCQ